MASVNLNDPLLPEFHEAQLVVRVAVSEVFRNCPRYVHRYQKARKSKYVPREGTETPFAGWKRVDDVQSHLPARDQGRAEREGGLRTRAEYDALVVTGDNDA